MILPFQVSLGSRCYAQLPCSVNADLPWHFLGGGTALLIKSLGKIEISRCQAAASVSEGNTFSTGHQARHDPRKGAETAATAGLVRGSPETTPAATWTRLFVGHDVFSVPISRVRCSKCPGGSPAEYIAWGDTNAPEADRREASALLAELVEKDHPRHKAVYSGMTIEELRQRVRRRASAAES